MGKIDEGQMMQWSKCNGPHNTTRQTTVWAKINTIPTKLYQQKQQQSQYFKSCSTRDINSSVVRTSLLVPRYLHPRSKAHRCKYMRVVAVVVVAVFVVVVADPSALGDVVPKQLQSHKKISMGFISRFYCEVCVAHLFSFLCCCCCCLQKQQQSQYFKSCSTRDINSSVVRTSLLVPRYLHPRSKAHRCKYMRYHQSSRNQGKYVASDVIWKRIPKRDFCHRPSKQKLVSRRKKFETISNWGILEGLWQKSLFGIRFQITSEATYFPS
jgi:hypothetical protein